ncbi:unnamed protein product, partial [Urochloa humidicola]
NRLTKPCFVALHVTPSAIIREPCGPPAATSNGRTGRALCDQNSVGIVIMGGTVLPCNCGSFQLRATARIAVPPAQPISFSVGTLAGPETRAPIASRDVQPGPRHLPRRASSSHRGASLGVYQADGITNSSTSIASLFPSAAALLRVQRPAIHRLARQRNSARSSSRRRPGPGNQVVVRPLDN